jgi:hypothetical protein
MSKVIVSVVIVGAFLGLSSKSAFAQEEVPKVELGPFFTLTRLRELDSTEFGFGGRVTFNPHKNVGLEGEFGYYPSIDLKEVARGVGAGNLDVNGKIFTGLFGVKLTPLRGEHAALFGKVRGGFARFSVDTNVPGLPSSFSISSTQFAVDYGGGFELFASKRIGFRFDAGDLYIRNSGHNLNFTAGVTFRF